MQPGEVLARGWILTDGPIQSLPRLGRVALDPSSYNPGWVSQVVTDTHRLVSFLDIENEELYLAEGFSSSQVGLPISTVSFAKVSNIASSNVPIGHPTILGENPVPISPEMTDENIELVDTDILQRSLVEFADKHHLY
jgi:hypothetical protein